MCNANLLHALATMSLPWLHRVSHCLSASTVDFLQAPDTSHSLSASTAGAGAFMSDDDIINDNARLQQPKNISACALYTYSQLVAANHSMWVSHQSAVGRAGHPLAKAVGWLARNLRLLVLCAELCLLHAAMTAVLHPALHRRRCLLQRFWHDY